MDGMKRGDWIVAAAVLAAVLALLVPALPGR